jgi:hypothetical protein
MSDVSEKLEHQIDETPIWTPPRSPEQAEKVKDKIYYDKFRKEYAIKNKRGCWLSLTESQIKKELQFKGISNIKDKNENVSEVDQRLIKIRDEFDVDYIGGLAGYRSGFYEMNGTRILVTDEPRIITPVQGDCSIIHSIFTNLLTDNQFEQLPYFYGWLKIGYNSLASGMFRPGQALVIAGERDCGKSLAQKIITLIFGGRSAKPYAYMSGRTDFNGEMFSSEHLTIEDDVSCQDIRTRREFGNQIKQVSANDSQRCHAKHRQGITLFPFWRLSITLNNEPENLQILPPVDDSIEDKLIILKAYKKPMPLPTITSEQRLKFWNTIEMQLPAFLHYLSTWKIPEHLISERYGIAHFHHPEIISELNSLSPEAKLMSIIDRVLFSDAVAFTPWNGTAEDLESVLFSSSAVQYEARKLLSWNTATGVYLGRLSQKSNRVINQRKSTLRLWTILPPEQDMTV